MLPPDTFRPIDFRFDPMDSPMSRGSLEEMIRQANPGLDAASPTFRTARLLLAARQVGQNIDKLTRFTGDSREFVARCARRLWDNGVWSRGTTVAAWKDAGENDLAFWADVKVAEGQFCRRMDEQGRLQWMPAGLWWKSFDAADPRAEMEMCVHYLPSASTPNEAPAQSGAARRDPAAATERRGVEAGYPMAAGSSFAAPVWSHGDSPFLGTETASVVLGGPFPEAVWLV